MPVRTTRAPSMRAAPAIWMSTLADSAEARRQQLAFRGERSTPTDR
jgi:hypothetical protein